MADSADGFDWTAIYTKIVETTEEGIVLIRPEGQIVYVNDAFCRQMGRSRSEMIGALLTSLMDPEGLAAFNARREKRKSGQLRQQYEVIYRHGITGERVYCAANVSPIFDHDNKLIFSMGMHADVTELKKTQLELSKTVDRLSKAQKMARLGFWERNPLTGETWWSTEMYSIFGVDKAAGPIGTERYLQMVHPDDRKKLQELRMQAETHGTPYSLEYRILRNSELRYLLNSVETQMDSQKQVVKLLGVMMDITERVQRESVIREAQEANRAKSIFLANISHELRTPMHGILSFAHFGKTKSETASKEKLKGYFEEIHDSASRLMNLLNELLDLSKLESGKVEYSMQNASLVEAAEGVRKELEPVAKEREIALAVECKDRLSNGQFDKERMAQVLRNLVFNAIKFSHRHTTVRIVIEKSAESLRCYVINKGVGIPPAELESIFESFSQSSKTRSGAGGTGLGLAICQEIVTQHQGRIWAESEADGDTKFIFELPLEQQVLAPTG